MCLSTLWINHWVWIAVPYMPFNVISIIILMICSIWSCWMVQCQPVRSSMCWRSIWGLFDCTMSPSKGPQGLQVGIRLTCHSLQGFLSLYMLIIRPSEMFSVLHKSRNMWLYFIAGTQPGGHNLKMGNSTVLTAGGKQQWMQKITMQSCILILVFPGQKWLAFSELLANLVLR